MQEYFDYLVMGFGAGLAIGLVMVTVNLVIFQIVRVVRISLSV